MNLQSCCPPIALALLALAALPATAGVVPPPPPPDPVHTLVAQLAGDYAGLPVQDDPRFGHSVALHGDTLAVGAPGTLTSSGGVVLARGAVFVFRRNPDNDAWQFVQRIAFGTGGNGRCGHAVALNDFSLLVGCPGHEVSGQARGRAVFYRRNASGDYVDPVVFADGSVQAGAQCGASVALIDSAPGSNSPLPMAAVGCPNRRDFPLGNVGLVGAVDVYSNFLGLWSQATSIIGPAASASGFGASVSLNRSGPNPGLTLLLSVGIPGTSAAAAGSVRVYAMGATVGQWSQEHALTGPGQGSRFGHSVHMRGGRLAVGAPERRVLNPALNPPAMVASGSVSIATRACNFQGVCGWSAPVQEYIAAPLPVPVTAAQNRLGHAVQVLEPNRVLAGEPWHPWPGFNGRGRHYVLEGGNFVLRTTEPFQSASTPATAEFGAAVSGDAQWLAVGAPGYPDASSGRVFVYAFDYDDTLFAHDFECNGGAPGCR